MNCLVDDRASVFFYIVDDRASVFFTCFYMFSVSSVRIKEGDEVRLTSQPD